MADSVQYTNKYRGKFQVEVTVRLVVDTLHPGVVGFSEVAKGLAEKLKTEEMEYRSTWNDAHITDCNVLKINPVELQQVPVIVPEEATEEQ